MLIVITTCPNLDEARSLAKKIVHSRLAACVQLMPQMTSIYEWEGEVREDPENLLLIKTTVQKWDDLHDLIVKEHSYSVPEIVGVEPVRISKPYGEWIKSSVGD